MTDPGVDEGEALAGAEWVRTINRALAQLDKIEFWWAWNKHLAASNRMRAELDRHEAVVKEAKALVGHIERARTVGVPPTLLEDAMRTLSAAVHELEGDPGE